MELKVRALDGAEEKSVQEVEEKLLEQHEKSLSDETAKVGSETEINSEVEQTIETPSSELNEEDVLSFIKKRYNKDINSVEDLFKEREASQDIPEDVSAYLEYRRKTGRGFEDYLKLNKDFDSIDDNDLLREYFSATEDGLDDDDIDVLMEDFSFDEELDDDNQVKKVKLAKKKAVAKAKKFFNEQKDMFKQPLESSTVGMSESEKQELEAYKQYLEQARTQEEELSRKRDWFVDKSNELFSDDFKGFDFTLGEKKLTYNPTSKVDELKQSQLDSSNFIKKFTNEEGLITDVHGYHRALAIAMNPERFAKFFYEQGRSEATEDVTKKIKNVNMSERKSPEVTNKGGFQVRSVNQDSGRGLKIRSKK